MTPAAPIRSNRVPQSAPCIEGGQTHAWEARGLDISAAGALVSVRSCVWCSTEQEKPYGAGSRRGWVAR